MLEAEHFTFQKKVVFFTNLDFLHRIFYSKCDGFWWLSMNLVVFLQIPTSIIDCETNFLSILINFFKKVRLGFLEKRMRAVSMTSSERCTFGTTRSAKNAVFWQLLTSLLVALHILCFAISKPCKPYTFLKEESLSFLQVPKFRKFVD